MVDWVLFVHLDDVAGVFVGFRALIAVGSVGMSDPHTVFTLFWLVWTRDTATLPAS